MPSISLPWLHHTLPHVRGLDSSRYGSRKLRAERQADNARQRAADALDLALYIGELIAGNGASAEETVAAVLVIADAFGLEDCDSDVTLNAVELTGHAAGDAVPLMGKRIIQHRKTDFANLENTQLLVQDIHDGKLTLAQARTAAAALLPEPELPGALRPWKRRYAGHALVGFIAAAASVLTGATLGVALCSLLAAVTGNWISSSMARYGVPAFYRFALAAIPAAAVALVVHAVWPGAASQSIVIAGVLVLLPTMAATSAVQDSLAGHYLTAVARLLETLTIFASVVLGTGLVLGLATRLGLSVPTLPSVRVAASTYLDWRLAAAAFFAVGIAARYKVAPRKWPAVGLLGLAGVVVYAELRELNFSPIAATGIAAVAVAIGGHVLARRARTSALPWVIPAAAPLLPGTLVYKALYAVTKSDVLEGMTGMLRALGVILALAGGISAVGETVQFLRRWRAVRGAARAEAPAAATTVVVASETAGIRG
ncbi:threonine/serine exporter family protein [Streptomyces sp. NBC_00237]|uniref:threonine/serine ThrE exporter family protein n=1 Tax=Streptomyces sp. NBC_00237 TaxID=2975687 RepID=UPI00224C9106|nr:threonine/serine exporter family protein [Streptomyces sp. NBC_00237]MCX5205023.1 threonine/serine exporter family protein [Streptomyces sp. NBC_00237]